MDNTTCSSQQSLNDDRKTVSIKENPEVFYVDRADSRKVGSTAASDEHVIQIEAPTAGEQEDDEKTLTPTSSIHSPSHHSASDHESPIPSKAAESHHSALSQSASHHSQGSVSHHSGQAHTALVIENPSAEPTSPTAASEARGSVRTGSKHSVKQERSSSSGSQPSSSLHSGSRVNGSVRKPSRQSSIRSSGGGSVRESRASVSLLGTKTSIPDSSAHSVSDDASLFITPMIQPLSQTDSVLNTKDVVDPFKAFARKIAAQFTPEDISAVHYLANIPERVQSKLSTGVSLINYLTNSRRMNIEFLTILLEEMERVDLLEELLAWVQDREDTARAAQKRGQRVGIAGPSEEESTFITVAQRMRERIMDPGTLVRGCEELVNLMGKIRAQVAECSISIILAAMRHHIMSEPVQEAGCVTLANVCYHHRGLHALIVMQGGVRHIQLAMRSHVSNDLVQRAACGAIANLALRYDDIRKQCVSDGVLKNIINAMSAHKEEVEVQEQGCCALCNMATNQPEIQQKIADMGGLECIVTALKVHKDDEMVVGNALTALQILCSYQKSVQEQCLKLHVMDYAINSMLMYPMSDIVMEAATGVLGNMCSHSSKNRVKAGKNGAIKMSIDAIKNMSANEDVVARALIMLTNVCFNNDLNRIIAKKLGAVEAIVIGMKAHPESTKVQRQACRAVSNICIKNVDLKQEVLSHDLIGQVVTALTNHVNESRVVEPVLSALYSLCVYHGLRQEIDETAIEDVITQIREHYPPESEIHEKASLTETELKSDENCFGFIGNWRRMSHAIWGGGDTVVEDERLDKTPGTTIPEQAKSAISSRIEGYISRASRKTTPMKVEVKEAPVGSKSPKIDEATAEVDLEAGVGPSTSGAGSPSAPGPLGLSLPPSAQPTSQPTSAPASATPVAKTSATGTPAAKTPASGKQPSKTPGSGTPAGKTPASGKSASKTLSDGSPAGKTPTSKQESAGPGSVAATGSTTKTPGVASKTPFSQGVTSKTPRSKQATPSVHFSPTKSSPHKSRAEAAEEIIARSQASQRSAMIVTPAKSSKSGISGKVSGRGTDEDRRSDRSISPSQRFTPNRGLTEAEIF